MKLLVTGGAGFIGSNFILYWMRRHPHDEILNVDKLTYAGNLENLKDLEKNPNYTFKKGDICDEKFVGEVMKHAEIVIHFAAESHVDRSIIGPAVFVQSNVVGTRVLLDWALKLKVKRFHHISTDEVYGSLELNSEEKFDEQTCYNPRSPYAASKAASDHLVRAYHITFGLPITLTNCSNNFGPYQFPEKLIPLAITNILIGEKVPIYGKGNQVRDWLYVKDHCRAIELVIEKGKIGETYCIGTQAEEITNLQVVGKIIKLLGKDKSVIEFVTDRPGHDVKYAMSSKKIENELGWKPKHQFDSRLKKTIAWYKSNESWWKHVKSGEYKEYYRKQYQIK
jgi:dTDP-glucose 4,6-dehydratase